MKHSIFFAATAFLALGACGKSETPAPEANASEAAEATSAAAAPAVAAVPADAGAFTAGEAPSKAFMVGTWGMGEGCEMPMTFAADGTVKGGPFEKWDIQGGNLSFEGSPQKMQLKVIDAKSMESRLDGADKANTLKRC